MKSIESYSLSELLEIQKIIEDEKLKNKLYQEIELRNNSMIDLEKYSSSRLPEFYEDYQEQCLKLLSELSFKDLSFLIDSASRSSGNNLDSHLSIVSALQEYMKRYQYQEVIQTIDEYFIEHPEKIYFCEGVYNTLNYIKTSITIMLNSKRNIETKSDLFLDFAEKKYLVTKNLRDISEQLFCLRSRVPDSRLCIGNQALIKNAKKYGEIITRPQDKFISSIAFGSTLEKLKEGNYEEAERLLFVPQSKVQKYLKK